jgi:hypothetical protein
MQYAITIEIEKGKVFSSDAGKVTTIVSLAPES